MSRAWLLGSLAFVALVAGLATLRGAELALTIPIVLYWGYCLATAPNEVRLEVQRSLSAERVPPGTPVVVQLSIVNRGDSVVDLALDDALPAGLELVQGSPRHLIFLERGKTFEFTYTVQGPRGGYAFAPLAADARDMVGLLSTRVRAGASNRLLVLPTIAPVKYVPIQPRRTRAYSGTIPARAGGSGVEFFGVRPYQIGDAARRINWRAMARHPEAIYSNEFQQERVADVAIVLDGRQRVDLHAPGQSLFEHSVVAAGSLASALLQQGNRVGLLVYSQFLRWTFPGYGRIQRERILHALALAAPGPSQVFEGLQQLPARLFPPESQIVLVSPVLEDDLPTIIQLRARGHQVLIICPDPVSLEVMALPRARSQYSASDVTLATRIVRLERRILLRRLRRAGVQVIEWDVSFPFDQAMQRAFRRLHQLRTPT